MDVCEYLGKREGKKMGLSVINRAEQRRASTQPTWGYLLGRIILGFAEILIPLAFIVGMVYWRAPQLFWAVVHFLSGEPILNL